MPNGRRSEILMRKPSDILTTFLRASMLRRRFGRGIFAAGASLAVGTCLAFLLLLTFSSPQSVFLPPALFLFGLLAGILLPLSRSETARLVDQRLDLRGRVLTACEMETSSKPYSESAVQVQRQDACMKIAHTLSTEPNVLERVFPLNFRSLFLSLAFYLSFTAIVFVIPIENLRITGRSSPMPSSAEATAPESAEDILAQVKRVTQRTAQENPQLVPVQELRERAERIFPRGEQADGLTAISVLKKLEEALAETVETLVAAEEYENGKGSTVPNTETPDNNAAVAALLREELGKLIECRLRLSETMTQSGGEGTADPGRSRKTWGSGNAGTSFSAESDPLRPYEETVDLAVPAALSGELTADSSDPNDLSSIPGRSVRGAGAFSIPAGTVPERPVTKEVIPPEREKLVRACFDY